VIQVKYQGLGNGWSLNDIQLQLYPSSAIISPRMDIDQDGRNEWSASSEGIGTWGSQDVFIDGNSSSIFAVGFNPTSWQSVLVPRNAKSFEVSADNVDSVGLGIQTVALWVGNTIVAQTGGVGYVDGLRLTLNQSEIEFLNYETSTTPPVKIVAGTEFVHARIELISDAGSQRLGGLSIGYDAEDTVSATAIDELVLAMNRARLVPNKAANLPLTFHADSACSLKVSLLSSTSREM